MNKMISITTSGKALASEPFSPEELVNLLFATIHGHFTQVVQQAPDGAETTACKEELYDMFNAAASAFLEVFAPEIELRPDLTAQAIMDAENNILAKQLKEIKDKK